MCKHKHSLGDIDSVFDEIEGTIIIYTTCKDCGQSGMIKVQAGEIEWTEGEKG